MEDEKVLLDKIKEQNNNQFETFKSSLGEVANKADIEEIVKAAKESSELTAIELAELKEIAKKQGEFLAGLKNGIQSEKNLTIAGAIVEAIEGLGIKNINDLQANKSKLQAGIELKANIQTSDYSGTVSRTQEVSAVRMPNLRPLAFIPYMGGGQVTGGKSILMWTPGTYTSNAGYAGEGANTVTENAGTATEKTRLMAKISAKQYLTAETFEDLPQFAQRMQEQMMSNAMLFLDSEIFGGIGADGGAHTQKIYGIKTQGMTAFNAAAAVPVEKANVSDLVDACATQAEIALHTVDTVWMHPSLVNKLRRTKDSTGQYIINKLVTGEEVMGGLRVVRTVAITNNELLVANARVLQLWIKRNMTLKIGQFGTDAEVDRYTAILFTRAQCLVEDEDKKGVIYVSDVTAALAAIDAGA